ncbi:cbb3-type cytochrome c oxidase subunit I [Microbulbifer donghaiensis]|nr:cbb3-type cytochrome c oxidase subunit I [Microbulbifer donghaiensis]
MKPANWWLPLLIVVLIGLGSLLFVGSRTYSDAPPMVDFINRSGEKIFSREQIEHGQVAFLKYGLMDFGSMFGDGAGRGPDFTADALHEMALAMQDFYSAASPPHTEFTRDAIAARVRREIKENGYDSERGLVRINAAQAHAYSQLLVHYRDYFRGKLPLLPALANADGNEIDDLATFFFWGAWVSGTQRPGKAYSYTNNWPYDPEAGNTPPRSTLIWSLAAILGLFLVLGVVLFLHGRFSQLVGWRARNREQPSLTPLWVNHFVPTQMQRATYKFFLAAALLFVLQVFSGVLTVHNFLGLNRVLGIDVAQFISLVSARGWHLQLALLWITACWVGASFFLLSASYSNQPPGQVGLVNLLFWMFVAMVVGNLAGVMLGPLGVFGEYWNLLGNQGWEFVEMGKLWQSVLMGILVLWAFILFRGIRANWGRQQRWLLPNWLFYCVVAVSLLFLSSFVAEPETNFVIADFWRWAVVHMWVEAFFEVFATILVAYVMYLMGFVSQQGASRVVYIAALLFLGSGLLGLSHNFYWNAKPVATLAVGSIFSTLQVVPLILLSLEAWEFRKLPSQQGSAGFGQAEAFLFLLGVNFWNFLGAGVFGFLINLPIINYYEHGTYLTVNHGHAAFMGVYGNLSLAALVFCSRYLISGDAWPAALVRRAFWSINIGLMLMVLMDLLPVGFDQLVTVIDRGFWFARSEEYIQSDTFQWLTWARIVGGVVFTFGGVLPLAWLMLSRYRARKAVEPTDGVGRDITPEFG